MKTNEKEIKVTESTLDSKYYLSFVNGWRWLAFRQFLEIFRKRLGADNFENKTEKAAEENTLTEIVLEYCFVELIKKARFHWDIGMKSGAGLSYLNVLYTVTSYKEKKMIASFAHAHSVGDLGYRPPNRNNYTALMRAKCEEFLEQYKVPIKMVFIKDPPRDYQS